jgi:hypothetical protein
MLSKGHRVVTIFFTFSCRLNIEFFLNVSSLLKNSDLPDPGGQLIIRLPDPGQCYLKNKMFCVCLLDERHGTDVNTSLK